MAKDIAPELYERCSKAFDREIERSAKIKKYLLKVEKGTATYGDMYYFSTEVGDCLARALQEINEDELPDNRMYYNIAERVVRPLMEKADLMISETCDKVQTTLNEKADLGIKAV